MFALLHRRGTVCQLSAGYYFCNRPERNKQALKCLYHRLLCCFASQASPLKPRWIIQAQYSTLGSYTSYWWRHAALSETSTRKTTWLSWGFALKRMKSWLHQVRTFEIDVVNATVSVTHTLTHINTVCSLLSRLLWNVENDMPIQNQRDRFVWSWSL